MEVDRTRRVVATVFTEKCSSNYTDVTVSKFCMTTSIDVATCTKDSKTPRLQKSALCTTLSRGSPTMLTLIWIKHEL